MKNLLYVFAETDLYEVLVDEHLILRITYYAEGLNQGQERRFDNLPYTVQEEILRKINEENEQS